MQYDHHQQQRNLAQIKGIFRAPFVTSGLQDSTAVFVVGMPRSGSTLVEQMLASHSEVCGSPCVCLCVCVEEEGGVLAHV
jgi:hypothetical protein